MTGLFFSRKRNGMERKGRGGGEVVDSRLDYAAVYGFGAYRNWVGLNG